MHLCQISARSVEICGKWDASKLIYDSVERCIRGRNPWPLSWNCWNSKSISDIGLDSLIVHFFGKYDIKTYNDLKDSSWIWKSYQLLKSYSSFQNFSKSRIWLEGDVRKTQKSFFSGHLQKDHQTTADGWNPYQIFVVCGNKNFWSPSFLIADRVSIY